MTPELIMIMQHERFTGLLPKPRSRVRIPKVAREAWQVEKESAGVIKKSSRNTPVTWIISSQGIPWQEANEAQMGGTYRGTFGPHLTMAQGLITLGSICMAGLMAYTKEGHFG